MEEKLVIIINDMTDVLNASQLKRLQEVLIKHLCEEGKEEKPSDNHEYLTMFLNAKKIEGCSGRTIAYYKTTIEHFLLTVQRCFRIQERN